MVNPAPPDPHVPDPLAMRAARAFLARISGQYPIVEALLYGSRARGDARADSDVDIAVVIETTRAEANHLSADLAGEAIDELLETGLLISPFVVARQDWEAPESFSNPFFLQNVMRDGVRL